MLDASWIRGSEGVVCWMHHGFGGRKGNMFVYSFHTSIGSIRKLYFTQKFVLRRYTSVRTFTSGSQFGIRLNYSLTGN